MFTENEQMSSVRRKREHLKHRHHAQIAADELGIETDLLQGSR